MSLFYQCSSYQHLKMASEPVQTPGGRSDRLYIVLAPHTPDDVYSALAWKVAPLEYSFGLCIPDADTPEAVIKNLRALTGSGEGIVWAMRPEFVRSLNGNFDVWTEPKERAMIFKGLIERFGKGKLEYERQHMIRSDGSRSYLFVLDGDFYIERLNTGQSSYEFAFCRQEVSTDLDEVMALPERERVDMLWLGGALCMLNKKTE